MDISSRPKKKSKGPRVLPDELFNRLHLIISFEDYSSSINSSSVSPSLVESYSPRILGSCTLAWNLPTDHLNIQYYRRCLVIPGEIPDYHPPPLHSYLPSKEPNSLIRQPRFTSVLPLLLTAKRIGIDIRDYDFISERNSLRRMAMNNENYTIGVVRFGRNIILRRYDSYRSIDKNDIGYRFEQMCTNGNHLDDNYLQLIGGQIGILKTLIVAEIDAIDRQTEQSIELKSQKKSAVGISNKQDWWLQAFLGGVTKIIHGCRAMNDPERLIHLAEYHVSDLTTDRFKQQTFEFLEQVLQFLSFNVIEERSYLLCRHPDAITGKHGLFLYEITHQSDKEKLTFLTRELLTQLLIK